MISALSSRSVSYSSVPIQEKTTEYLGELSKVLIRHNGCKLDPTDILQQSVRTGKAIRFVRWGVGDSACLRSIPFRSVYDHISSLGYNADLLIDLITVPMAKQVNRDRLAQYVVFHDVCEVVTGDIPNYTSEKVAGALYRSGAIRKEVEHKANLRIITSLKNTAQQGGLDNYGEVASLLERTVERDLSDFTSVFFEIVDRTDPIIGIWRHIDQYRREIATCPDAFLAATADFFNNDLAATVCRSHNGLRRLVMLLSNRDNAMEYIVDRSVIDDLARRAELPAEHIHKLIEGREMACVSKETQARFIEDQTSKPADRLRPLNLSRPQFGWSV